MDKMYQMKNMKWINEEVRELFNQYVEKLTEGGKNNQN